MVGLIADGDTTDGFADLRMGSVGTSEVFGADFMGLACLRAEGDLERDFDGVFVVSSMSLGAGCTVMIEALQPRGGALSEVGK